MKSRFFFLLTILATLVAPQFVLAVGGCVTDATEPIPGNEYVTISVSYSGQRYYLGVDTVAAKADPAEYKLMAYTEPSYATMWTAGCLFSSTGAVLADHSYQRTYQNVYLAEKYPSAPSWLMKGERHTHYSDLTLSDEANSTMFYTEYEQSSAGRYAMGHIYYMSIVGNETIYRYLRYDPLYGFDRLMESKGSTAQRISTWSRATGTHLTCQFDKEIYTFELSTNAAGESLPFTMTVTKQEGGDVFRSRYDYSEVAVTEPTTSTITEGVTLAFDWTSTEGNTSVFKTHELYLDGEEIKTREKDSLMMRINSASTAIDGDHFTNTIYSIGVSPFSLLNTDSVLVDHTDYLHAYMTYGGNSYVDSVQVVRKFYQNDPFTTLKTTSTPTDYTFPFATTEQTTTVTVTAQYQAGNRIRQVDGTLVSTSVGEQRNLNLLTRPCYRDTTWAPVLDAEGDTTGWSVQSVSLMDTLLVNAYLSDGTTTAISGASGSTAESWIKSVRLTARNTIEVVATGYSESASGYRVAQLKCSYTYRHSSAAGDTARATQTIWILQSPFNAGEGLITFYHQTGRSGLPMVAPYSRQQVPEICMDYYAIPGEANPLPINYDLWGYNRWFIYQAGDNRGKAIDNNWTWTTKPTDANGDNFAQLNSVDNDYSRGVFQISPQLGTPYNETNIPAVDYKAGKTVTTYTDTLGCDISAYTDTISVGTLANSNMSEFTEPTLSYRQLFNMQPAKESADIMAGCLSSGSNYVEEDATYLAPINRNFILQPKSAYSTDTHYGSNGNLQYVYYFNPNESDNLDPKMGTSEGLDLTEADSYCRVGLTKQTGDTLYHAKLLSRSDITGMDPTDTINVIMVNPRKSTGYALGRNGTSMRYEEFGSVTDTASLRAWVESTFLNTNDDMSGYKLTLTKESDSEISIKNGDDYLWYSSEATGITSADYYLLWGTNYGFQPDYTMDFDEAGDASGKYIQYTQSESFKLKMYAAALLGWWLKNEGYLSACTYKNEGSRWNPRWVYNTGLNISEDKEVVGDNANQAWMFYEIVEPVGLVDHKETATWQRKVGSGEWVNMGDGWTGTVLDGGGLETSYDGAARTVVQYRLVTEHFNLAHFTVNMRDPAEEGPMTTPIVSEDDFENNYELVYDFGMDQLPDPGTTDIVTPYKRMEFNHTQFSYHYPVGTSDYQIPETQRVFGDDMPGKGEYCTTNKFQKDDHSTVEVCAGAENSYMYCFNRGKKPLEFVNFLYPLPQCHDQNFYILANFCNPTPVTAGNPAPQIKAEYFGYDENGVETKLYTFLTGELTKVGEWYQVVVPLFSSVIANYKYFRCVGTVQGAENDAFLLFDRFRLVTPNRAITSFQKHTTCVNNDSIYILSRFDYQGQGLENGDIIAYQYQKWNGSAWVAMETSSESDGTYTRLTANEIEVYPSYYKEGMTADESVTTASMKSVSTKKDYGIFVVPEDGYDPSTSDTLPSLAVQTKLHELCNDLGETATARDGYLDERDLVANASDITLGESFDFGAYANPKMKVYVNEGEGDDDYWVVYLVNRFSIHETQNDTFRIAMTKIGSMTTRPNFANAVCANERFVTVKGSVTMQVDGETHTNHLRSDGDQYLKEANSVHTVKVQYNAPGDKIGTAIFDLFRSDAWDRDYENMTDEQQAAADATFKTMYGCTRYDFREAMRLLRSPAEGNTNQMATSWAEVTRAGCEYATLSEARTDSLYAVLEHLVSNRYLELGLSERDIYLGSNQDAYAYIFPVPASGRYTVPAHDGSDSTASAVICDHYLWLELHAKASQDSLRFGYDKRFGETYMVPVIRASKTEANSALKVRIAAFTHDNVLKEGIVIGWDSTHVVETNDPAWVAGTSTFRYTQDRIVQESTYDEAEGLRGYYYQGDTVTFTPVDEAHITELQGTGYTCLDYDPLGTTYDASSPRTHGDTEGTNVFVTPKLSDPQNGCNKWHVKSTAGYQTANNFTLHAGYWYKFKTAFFQANNSSGLIYANAAGDGVLAGYTYFIVAVAPDTVRWTPTDSVASNYWNDDDNWTPIVNGAEQKDALAKVPMGDSRVIIGAPALENMLPVVDNDSLGDVTKGEVDWGFRTATCKEVLFKPKSLMYGQEILNYNRAFVDVRMPYGTWRTFSPAIDNIYSGDIYVPSAADPDFAPGACAPQDRLDNLFFQSYYNQTVKEAFYNTDLEGNPYTEREKTSAQWQQTNVLDQAMPAGKACALIGWGLTENEDLIVRLPKQSNTYYYTKTNGTQGQAVTITRPAFADIDKNLAFDKTKKGEAEGVTYNLTNGTAAQLFFFGNPTMSLIDVYQLCKDNEAVLEKDAQGNFNVTELVDGFGYTTHKVSKLHQFYLSPMRAIGLKAGEPSTSLNILLKPSAMVAMPGSMTPIPAGGAAKAPRRRMTEEEEPSTGTLFITATNSSSDGNVYSMLTMMEYADANDSYDQAEDALLISSPLMENSYNFHTPIGLYSICDNRPLMLDVRSQMSSVPLALSLMTDAYTFSDYTTLSFSKEGQWTQPLYFMDAHTGDSILIRDGLQIAIQTPQNDQIRYYINGRQSAASGEGSDPGVITGVDVVEQEPILNSNGKTIIYDVLGRKLITIGENELITNIQLPTGVYIIQSGNNVERVVIR